MQKKQIFFSFRSKTTRLILIIEFNALMQNSGIH